MGAFSAAGDKTMVMGDMVLQEDQINPVMSTALVTRIIWRRVLATYLRKSGKPATAKPKPKPKPKPKSFNAGKTSLDPKPVEAIIGSSIEKAGEIYKVTIGRTTQMDGHTVGKTMGVNIWAVFAGSNDKAIVKGDFAVLESELQGVLEALCGAGVAIITIHNHMVGESPRILFLHYWGEGSVNDLAKALKAALNTQSKT